MNNNNSMWKVTGSHRLDTYYCYHNKYRIHTDTERSTSPESDSEPPVQQPRLSAETNIVVFADRMSDRKPTDHDNYQLTVNHFTPDPTYKFPKILKSGPCFQHKCLITYPWLRYSKQQNGGYCLPRVLFSRSTNLCAAPGMLVTNHLTGTSFKKAIELLDKHADKLYHKTSVAKLEDFQKVIVS